MASDHLEPKTRVVIVGAGLGGLAAAIAISLTGAFHVTVLEAATALGEIGAGIQLSPNCALLLIRWGCLEYLEDVAVKPHFARMMRWQDSKLLVIRPTNPMVEERYGSPHWHIHRADLHDVLLRRARSFGVKVRTGCRVTDVATGDSEKKASVLLHSGESVDCDFLIGADGVHSRVREAVCPGFAEPRKTGDLAYRFTVPTSVVKNDPLLSEMAREPCTSIWWGPGRHVVGYMLRSGDTYNVVAMFPDDGSVQDGYKASATLEQMKTVFKGWCPQVCRLLTLAQPEGLAKWVLMDLPPLPTWNKGVCALLGDSCHPMLPYLAQGSAQAIEDAAVLAQCLSNMQGDLETAAGIYTKIRYSRATKVQEYARSQRQINHMEDGAEQEARDAIMAGTGQAPAWRWKWEATEDEAERSWPDGLFAYDAEKSAKRALSKHRNLTLQHQKGKM